MKQKELCEKIIKRPRLCTLLRAGDLFFALCVYASYIFLLIMTFLNSKEKAAYAVIICAVPFIVLSLFRKAIDAKRPYEVYGFEPIIKRKKDGKSFPSRHVFSAAIISCVSLWLIPWLGIALSVITLIISFLRYITGLHFIRDLSVGLIMGVIFAFIGILISGI